MAHPRHAAFFGLAGLALSCATRGADKPKTGQLGNSTFFYLCDQRTYEDPYCDVLVDTKTFPTIALGASFFLKAQSNSSTSSIFLEPTTPDRLKPPASGTTDPWVALAPGFTSVITPGENQPKPDYIDVAVKAPAKLELTEITEGVDGKVSGTVGKLSGDFSFSVTETFLRVAPLDATGAPVAGTLADPWLWTTSNAAVVSFASDPSKHIVKISAAGAKGTAMLTVKSGTLTATTAIVVK